MTNSSSNSSYGGIYEVNTIIGNKSFDEDKNYDIDGVYNTRGVEKSNRWIRDINLSIEDSDKLEISFTSSAPNSTGEEMFSFKIKKEYRKNFIKLLKDTVSMLERKK